MNWGTHQVITLSVKLGEGGFGARPHHNTTQHNNNTIQHNAAIQYYTIQHKTSIQYHTTQDNPILTIQDRTGQDRTRTGPGPDRKGHACWEYGKMAAASPKSPTISGSSPLSFSLTSEDGASREVFEPSRRRYDNLADGQLHPMIPESGK